MSALVEKDYIWRGENRPPLSSGKFTANEENGLVSLNQEKVGLPVEKNVGFSAKPPNAPPSKGDFVSIGDGTSGRVLRTEEDRFVYILRPGDSSLVGISLDRLNGVRILHGSEELLI